MNVSQIMKQIRWKNFIHISFYISLSKIFYKNLTNIKKTQVNNLSA